MALSSIVTLNPARLNAAQAQSDILNRAEAAAYLNISPQTLTKYVKRGAVPCRQVARRLIFSRRALERWAGGENVQTAGTSTADQGDGAPIMANDANQ
ncbi:MAG: helix-turn-helix domain-containing protein [Thermoguttaceae bacterium]|nr:helix-turn-helix domain-containing protein [Thermoguttaceae bacterium]